MKYTANLIIDGIPSDCLHFMFVNIWWTRMHSSRMRTARSLLYWGGLPNRDSPPDRDPWRDSPGQKPLPVNRMTDRRL